MLKAALDIDLPTASDKTSSKESVEPEDDFLSELTKEWESEDSVGEKFRNEQLSKLISKLQKAYYAKAARVNAEIWRRLREHTKKRDHVWKSLNNKITGWTSLSKPLFWRKPLVSNQVQVVRLK